MNDIREVIGMFILLDLDPFSLAPLPFFPIILDRRSTLDICDLFVLVNHSLMVGVE